ncbi:hypothetical protein CAEBREN_20017 [Caenorhabditis brenneri]|uniref:DOCKER domain-containing protein n=1 Tax=Caenorhabditis brenneri TaxID=135651 RepID=G0MJM0_CAEBE|nr:hypothetical protein CAEBREN_20017 [Caenorhabditis brenneri]
MLSDVPFDRLLVYLPIVLGRLFAILPQAPTDQLAIATMRSIIGEEDMNASGSTNSIAFRVLQLVNLSQEVALNVLDVAQTFAHQLASSQRHRHWPHSFDLVVLDLLRQLRGVMPATVALKDAANDPIRLADLHLQLADSYRGSAALRSPWFDTLAELYEQDRWFAEASVCHAHSVAIIARELEEKKELEVDWRIFNWINNQIAETEQSLGEDAGNVQPAGFTTENLGAKIDKTAAALMLAERFEAVGPLYRLIVPVLEKNTLREPAIHEQSLKRTIIKVNSGGFPSTRRRLPVTSVHYEQFSPLEFACQKLNTKAEQIRKTLSAASNGRRLDVKGLQLLLQGAVLPTVNAGPLSYAEVFTKDYQQEKYGEDVIVKLRESFRNLMNACQLARRSLGHRSVETSNRMDHPSCHVLQRTFSI